MKKKYFVFGASSEIAKKLINKISLKDKVICFSSKKNSNKKAGVDYIKTNYSSASIKKILNKKINIKKKIYFYFLML